MNRRLTTMLKPIEQSPMEFKDNNEINYEKSPMMDHNNIIEESKVQEQEFKLEASKMTANEQTEEENPIKEDKKKSNTNQMVEELKEAND